MSEKEGLNDDQAPEDDAPETVENSVYSDTLAKLINLHQLSDNEENHRNVLNDGAKYLSELITVMDEHKDETLTQETAVIIEEAFQSFANGVCQISIKDSYENDSKSAKECFYSYLNLLNLPPMKRYFQREEIQQFHHILYGEFLSSIFWLATEIMFSCNFSIVDLEEPRDSREIFLLMLDYMKGEFDPGSTLPYSTTTQLILSCLWNYADRTIVVPNLIKTGYPQAVLQWISNLLESGEMPVEFNFCNSSAENGSKIDCVQPLINIINNISRHDDGIFVLNALHATNVVKKLQSSIQDLRVNIVCCMSLALLSSPEQIKNDRKHMNNALDQLLQNVSNASQSEDYNDDGSHISEPLVVLVKLFNDDRALDYILQHAQVELNTPSTVDFFINLLIQFHESVNHEKDPLKDLTCIALVNILWSISFQEHYQYSRQMKTNQQLIQLIKQFAHLNQINENIPQTIQTAAKGILFNITETISTNKQVIPSIYRKRQSIIEELVPSNLRREDNNEEKKNRSMIMISYSHDDKTLCYQLEDELKKLDQFDIWIDKEFCTSGDSWEHIAQGIKQSQVVLCLITKNYTSKSVRREVIYAINKLDKPLLPLFVLKPNVPEWLEIRTCDLTHVRLTDEKQFDRSKMSKLIQTLNQLISRSKQDIDRNDLPPTHYEPSQTRITTNISQQTIPTKTDPILKRINLSEKRTENWDEENIQQWFQDNGILMELCDLYQFHDGSELLSYTQLLFQDDKIHYLNYSQEFQRQFNKTLLPHQFYKFVNSLRKLTNEPNRSNLHSTPAPTTASVACIIL